MSSDRLPSEWVDQLFKRLSVRYGKPFMARWDGVEIDDVKADWAQVLAGFRARPDCIAYGLDNLPPDRPPTATQFRDLCRAKPETTQAPRLDWKRGPIPADVANELDRIKEPADVEAQYAGPKGWAYQLRDRESHGGVMAPYVRRLWREAVELRNEGEIS